MEGDKAGGKASGWGYDNCLVLPVAHISGI